MSGTSARKLIYAVSFLVVFILLSPSGFSFPSVTNYWIEDAGLSASITYELKDNGDGTWTYKYYVTNNGETNTDPPYNQDYYIDRFGVVLADAESNITNISQPTSETPWTADLQEEDDWTQEGAAVIQLVWKTVDQSIPSDGMIPEGYTWGTPADTFTYTFSWDDPFTTPGAQTFSVHFKYLNPIDGNDSGWYHVPEPSVLLLLFAGMGLLLWVEKRK